MPTAMPLTATRCLNAVSFATRSKRASPIRPNKIGPNLHGLFDREAGKEAGFNYSKGLASADFKWDDAKLDEWLTKPQNFIAGAKMPFNVPNAQDGADVITYLHKAAEAP